jgi:hypothetical protein
MTRVESSARQRCSVRQRRGRRVPPQTTLNTRTANDSNGASSKCSTGEGADNDRAMEVTSKGTASVTTSWLRGDIHGGGAARQRGGEPHFTNKERQRLRDYSKELPSSGSSMSGVSRGEQTRKRNEGMLKFMDETMGAKLL